jgi:XTP/dITP diphosphohydrolase
MKLCFATNNKHKLEEVGKAIGDEFELIGLKELSVFDELPETQDSFEGNALQKAQFVFDRTGVPCFADDSGLEVEALNGNPGVFSAMYAGPHRDDDDNIRLLLTNLADSNNRSAKFRTVVALVGLGKPKFFEGTIQGEILKAKRGSNGFGYDPVFVPSGQSKTFAEMSLDEKNKVSHRSIAIQKLVGYLKQVSTT